MSEEIKEMIDRWKRYIKNMEPWHDKYVERQKLLVNYIEQLQQENEELKQKYSKLEDKYIKNTPCCNENDCDLYKEYLNDKNILTEFEKWLEEEKKKENWKYGDMYFNEFANIVLDKLQELKEGKK